jgi:hypothetical protein
MLAHMADSLETLDEFVEMKCATEENGDLSLADIHSLNWQKKVRGLPAAPDLITSGW